MLQQTIKGADRTSVYWLVFSIPAANMDNITEQSCFQKLRNCIEIDIIEIIA